MKRHRTKMELDTDKLLLKHTLFICQTVTEQLTGRRGYSLDQDDHCPWILIMGTDTKPLRALFVI